MYLHKKQCTISQSSVVFIDKTLLFNEINSMHFKYFMFNFNSVHNGKLYLMFGREKEVKTYLLIIMYIHTPLKKSKRKYSDNLKKN